MHFEKLLHLASALNPTVKAHDAINACTHIFVALNLFFMVVFL